MQVQFQPMGIKIPPRVTRPGALGRPAPAHAFKPGKSGNPRGRPKGSLDKLTRLKNTLIATSGMTPVEFMTFVYRDQLYDQYDEKLSHDGRTTYYTKAEGAQKIEVTLNQRIVCAQGAAPYVHKRMPIGIEVKEKNTAIISTEKLRTMDEKELGKLLDFMDQFGLSVDLASTSFVPGLPAPEENND